MAQISEIIPFQISFLIFLMLTYLWSSSLPLFASHKKILQAHAELVFFDFIFFWLVLKKGKFECNMRRWGHKSGVKNLIRCFVTGLVMANQRA